MLICRWGRSEKSGTGKLQSRLKIFGRDVLANEMFACLAFEICCLIFVDDVIFEALIDS